MTDRVKGLMVALTEDIRIDDIKILMDSIRMFKYVADVKPINVNFDDQTNRMTIKYELINKIYDILKT